jgi:hypothetical protein
MSIKPEKKVIVLSSFQEDLLNFLIVRCPENSNGMFGLEVLQNDRANKICFC